jgi:hypothetical protein
MLIEKNLALTTQTGLIKRTLKEDAKSPDRVTLGGYKPDEDFLKGDKIKSLNGSNVKETKSPVTDHPVTGSIAKTALASILGITIGCIFNAMRK